VNHHYPVAKDANKYALAEVCRDFKINWLDPGMNVGLHRGLNWAISEIGLTRDDLLIVADPDTNPVTLGWDAALLQVAGDPSSGWVALSNSQTPMEIASRPRDFEPRIIRGVQAFRALRPAVVSIAAYRLGWVLAAGGFHEPCKFYGHLESAMFQDLEAAGQHFVLLRNYREDDEIKAGQDEVYAQWKEAHAFRGYDKNFDEFLIERFPELLT
jgi:hypothetical protein